jgi:hypothetical protein
MRWYYFSNPKLSKNIPVTNDCLSDTSREYLNVEVVISHAVEREYSFMKEPPVVVEIKSLFPDSSNKTWNFKGTGLLLLMDGAPLDHRSLPLRYGKSQLPQIRNS